MSENSSKLAALEAIEAQMRASGVTLDELGAYLSHPRPTELVSDKPPTSQVASRIFGLLGGVFIMGGIGAFISNFWDDMGSLMRIAITLGIGLALTLLMLFIAKERRTTGLVRWLIFLAPVIQTSGWFVLIDELFPKGDDPKLAALIVFLGMAIEQGCIFLFSIRRNTTAFIALFFIYGFLSLAFDRVELEGQYIGLILGASMLAVGGALARATYRPVALICYFFGAITFHSGLAETVSDLWNRHCSAIVTGLSLCSLAYGLRLQNEKRLPGFGFFLGSGFFFAGFFELVRDTPLELLYLAVAIAIMYLSTILPSTAVLLNSVVALLGFIGYYTTRYFVDSLGWPLALIFMGISFVGVSAFALRLKRESGSFIEHGQMPKEN